MMVALEQAVSSGAIAIALLGLLALEAIVLTRIVRRRGHPRAAVAVLTLLLPGAFFVAALGLALLAADGGGGVTSAAPAILICITGAGLAHGIDVWFRFFRA